MSASDARLTSDTSILQVHSFETCTRPSDKAGLAFRTEKDKANEHLLTGAYLSVRDRNKAQFNAVFRRVINASSEVYTRLVYNKLSTNCSAHLADRAPFLKANASASVSKL